jgi:CxxC-x17-CxxC domain-containing protein
MDNQDQSSPRQMFDGDWQCSGCDAKITQLPFQPNDDQSLLCLDCYRNKKQSEPQQERQKFQGDWECATCGTKITELPFQPSGNSPLYCLDCHRKSKEQ